MEAFGAFQKPGVAVHTYRDPQSLTCLAGNWIMRPMADSLWGLEERGSLGHGLEGFSSLLCPVSHNAGMCSA